MIDRFATEVTPDWRAFVDCLRRTGTPERVHFIELFLDGEIQSAVCERFALLDGLDREDPYFGQKKQVAIQRFLGYDYVVSGLDGMAMPLNKSTTEDTADLKRSGGRTYTDMQGGPITSWEEFETYPWPDPDAAETRRLDWYEENLPEDMCVIGGLMGHFAEYLCWLPGYQTLCMLLYDQRDLVRAISDRILEIDRKVIKRVLAYDRVKVIWGSDDMGFHSQTLISPDDMREFVLPGHRELAQAAHDAGRPYILHSCGNLTEIMDDLIDDAKIDGKHSFEDSIESVILAKKAYGDRLSLLGGIDMDFICRASEEDVRARVRETIDSCQQGGGFCLGTGNSVANYVPLDNYLAMLDEGRKHAS